MYSPLSLSLSLPKKIPTPPHFLTQEVPLEHLSLNNWLFCSLNILCTENDSGFINQLILGGNSISLHKKKYNLVNLPLKVDFWAR